MRAAWLASLLAASAPALGQQADAAADVARTLDAVVVSARLERVAAFDMPASVDTVELEQRPAGDVGDALGGLPGVAARDRQNQAQDLQLSIRGFGARATFGVRGIRLYADGIPAAMPDGQGQLSHFALMGGGRIEVLRGPFSALHGNSSGGVVQWWSAEPTEAPEFALQASLGRDQSRTLGARLRGSSGAMGYNLSAYRAITDGYRDHSAAARTQLHAKLAFDLGSAGTLDVVANRLDAPQAQDPLGLTRAQADADPTQATAVAALFDTRKSVLQDQLGLLYARPLAAGTLRASAWAGRRRVGQYLSVPAAAQANPLSGGGVIDLDGGFAGIDLRWSWQGQLGGRPAELHVGANAERMDQDRRGFENFAADRLGVRGRLRRDERNLVRNLDQYSQAWWQFAPDWSLLLGARHSAVRFEANDRYVTATNPDDSGRVRHARTTPVAGLVRAFGEDLRLYLSAGSGFETPTFNELGYRVDGGAGLALDLRPSVSRNLELGGKWRGARGAWLQVAAFRIDTRDELAVARNVGGRSSYRNVGASRRSGVELSAALPLARDWTLEAAYTGLDARFRQDFPICTGAGCSEADTLVAAGSRIPGIARHQLQAALQWRADDWWATLEAIGNSDIAVNDVGDEHAPGHLLANLAIGRRWRLGDHRVEAFLRVDNLLDRAYIGSVIVNEGNRRYHEPGPGRGVQLGLRWQWQGAPR